MKWKNEIFDNTTLLISASSGETSINAKVYKYCLNYLQQKKIKCQTLDLKKFKATPILCDSKQIPKEIEEIYKCIKDPKHLIFFVPEHNGYFSAFFKNILDWLSLKQKNFLKNKKIILISASTTQKDKRIMEPAALNTMKIFEPENIEFINFKEYSEEKIPNFVKAIFV
ncbi:NADPH-dependent FMN reductase [Candidatus Mycoplasma haematohominis]|uniref:NADPH-dependent FMN reductase n=2 Tax=Candidatus Mycoplasma haematohominis TaxID=1494318 RepID=A0A478FQ03_9MOLU|nr:NADPH-dependent FMN reductase [Candidatus Mycoplasma haemohominis]